MVKLTKLALLFTKKLPLQVPIDQNPEPGWLAGQINGHTGWFPESYAEKYEDDVIEEEDEEVEKVVEEEAAAPVIEEVQSTEIPATVEANNFNGNMHGEKYIACYPYQSAEVGDLNFEVGDEMVVIKKEGDWWTGVIGTRSGMFPANYVQPYTDNNTSTSVITHELNNINGSNNQDQAAVMSALEDAANQADVDSEVSQINTQNVANDASMQEFRGMTSSAVRIHTF